MQELLKLIRPSLGSDAISDCAKNLKDLKKLKSTYPQEVTNDTAVLINLKA